MKKLFSIIMLLILVISLSLTSCNAFLNDSEDITDTKDDTAVETDNVLSTESLKKYTRIDAEGNENENGEYISFGSYPQSRVYDEELIGALNIVSGANYPTSGGWISYGYYQGDGNVGSQNNDIDYMWYIDVVFGGETYRGVYFNRYRKHLTSQNNKNYYNCERDNSNQYSEGYSTGLYWFKYEPIQWRILEEKDGKAFLLCEMIIDSQPYQNCLAYINSDFYATDDDGNILTDSEGNMVYSNNYEYSTIRKWLNDSFYNTAFNELQKQMIELTVVDNSYNTVNTELTNSFCCENTEDYVFLLSYQDAINSEYGFDVSRKNDVVRIKTVTAYAVCQGADRSGGSYYKNSGQWWLRSPISGISRGALYIKSDGWAGGVDYYYVDHTSVGVCPALWITL